MEDSLHLNLDKYGCRRDAYAELVPQIRSVAEGETHALGVLANVTAMLRDTFGERFFWVGFYFVEGEQLLLGPFQGTPACMSIKRGKGVCGTAWEQGRTIIVDDVELFPGHIACSSLSRSEIVVPVKDKKGHVLAVLDIDSTQTAAFDEEDRIGLEAVCEALADLTDSFVKH
jgi:GAF domain-containing protein